MKHDPLFDMTHEELRNRIGALEREVAQFGAWTDLLQDEIQRLIKSDDHRNAVRAALIEGGWQPPRKEPS
jgi:hypothetical protein